MPIYVHVTGNLLYHTCTVCKAWQLSYSYRALQGVYVTKLSKVGFPKRALWGICKDQEWF